MKNNECPLEQDEEEEEEEEEEDEVDFNPFLKETSVEASSSLSSEIEELDSGVVESSLLGLTLLSKSPDKVQGRGGVEARKNGTSCKKDGNVTFRELNTTSNAKNLVVDIEDEEAICRRTRARYSLAQFTLDELETFLQETDDDEGFQNVNDEQEYRKFLTAVLHGDANNQEVEVNGNIYDEDEDNDADFELEIEEALESDVDENIVGGAGEQANGVGGRRPRTRQNKRQKVSGRKYKKSSGKLNRPLRPLLPNTPIAPFPTPEVRKDNLVNAPPHCYPSSAANGNVNGFTTHQIGQLHCLIHEHVQLLVQVFSLCVFEPSREPIASDVKCLILEMQQKREQALALRRVPYPAFCFCAPYIRPSVADELENINFASKDKDGDVSNGHVDHSQTPKGSVWLPLISGPVLSVTDVAPLHLVGGYMDEVSTAVREYRRRYIESSPGTSFEKEPLFPFQPIQASTEANGEVPRGTNSPVSKLVGSPGSNQSPKKSMAATLVEKTKKESVAPVPKSIAKLAQRFFPLFNPGLYPHKPPPISVTNRLLFTDAEDNLLAMGLMEYNTDWKAIQQRFLPCKSKHQIFVRQKNRASSKAPENPIKAVRRLKNSPLTPEEKLRIQEGLKFFKLDWGSVWKFIVPYRDPSLLPRQWRIATGTQKSYITTDAARKEKRRLYESARRHSKSGALARLKTSSENEDCSTDGENNSGDDYRDNQNETYVHEAFLADFRPSTSRVPPVSNLGQKPNPPSILLQGGCHTGAQFNNCGSRDVQMQLNYSQHLHTSSSFQPNQLVSHVPMASPKPQIILRPYRARRTSRARLVKLAPGLPPVNLPPSVRVMSQSAFQNFQGGQPSKVSGTGVVHRFGPPSQNIVRALPCATNMGLRQDKTRPLEKDDSDLQMHPLLFEAPEVGQLPYYPLNCSTNSSSSSYIFPTKSPQLNLNLFQHHQKENETLNFFEKSLKSKEGSSSSFGIDFHPLLQRTNNVNSNPVTEHPAVLTDQCAQIQNPVDPALPNSLVNSSPVATFAIPSSPLDLEMHLSFSSRKDKAGGKRVVSKHMTRSSQREDFGAHDSIIPDSNGGDQPLPEIVMEQEELSDSEDEIGEGVEFECEEMDDSEEEVGSDYGQIGDMQNKEVPHVATEITSIDADFNVHLYEPNAHYNSEGYICDPIESSTFRMTMTAEQEKANRTSTSLLNLNSCPPFSPIISPEDPDNNRSTSCLSRSCKNTTEQSNLDSLAVTPLREPRKCSQETTSKLRTSRARKRDASLKTGAPVEIYDPASPNQEIQHAARERTSISAHDNSEGNIGDPSESSTFRMNMTAEQEKANKTSSLLFNLNSCPSLVSPEDPDNTRSTSCLSRSCKNTAQQSNLDSLAVTPLREPRKCSLETASKLRTSRARNRGASLTTGGPVEIPDPASANQEILHATTEMASVDADFNDHQYEPSAHDNFEVNIGDPSESSAFRMNLKPEQEKADQTSSLLLNLNSYPPLSPIMSPEDPDNSRTTSHISRSCKNTTQQSNLDSLAVTPLQEPITYAQKNTSKLRTTRAQRRDDSSKTGAPFEISDPACPNQDFPHAATEVTSVDAAFNDHKHEPSAHDNSERNIDDPSESSKFGMNMKAEQEKANKTSTLLFNLNSCLMSPQDPGNNRTTSRSSRSRKNATQQSNLAPLQKHRKCAQETASKLHTSRARKRDASSETGAPVEISDPACPNQEVPHAATKVTSIDADFNDHQHEPGAHDNSERNIDDPLESSSFGMNMKAEQEKANKSSTLPFNLNSSPMSPQDSGSNRSRSSSRRSRKNTTQKSNLDTLAATALRKPRKCPQKTVSTLSTSQARKGDTSSETGAPVEKSDPACPNQEIPNAATEVTSVDAAFNDHKHEPSANDNSERNIDDPSESSRFGMNMKAEQEKANKTSTLPFNLNSCPMSPQDPGNNRNTSRSSRSRKNTIQHL